MKKFKKLKTNQNSRPPLQAPGAPKSLGQASEEAELVNFNGNPRHKQALIRKVPENSRKTFQTIKKLKIPGPKT